MVENIILVAATVAIAVFTLVLAVASVRQGRSIQKTIELTHDEFTATHRPEVVVHAIDPHLEMVDGVELIGASVWCFNKGSTAAVDVKVRGEITRTVRPPFGHQWDEVKTRATKIARGGKHQFYMRSAYSLSEEAIRQSCSNHNLMLCVGTISYCDEAGERYETGFCRAFRSDTQTWQDAEMPEHEYAY